MTLTSKEKEVITLFKNRIHQKYPGEILKIVVYGSKARGNAKEESDIDLIVVISSEDWRKVDEIRNIGYELDEEIGYKLSIQVVSKSHVDYLRNYNFQFLKNIEKEGMTI